MVTVPHLFTFAQCCAKAFSSRQSSSNLRSKITLRTWRRSKRMQASPGSGGGGIKVCLAQIRTSKLPAVVHSCFAQARREQQRQQWQRGAGKSVLMGQVLPSVTQESHVMPAEEGGVSECLLWWADLLTGTCQKLAEALRVRT